MSPTRSTLLLALLAGGRAAGETDPGSMKPAILRTRKTLAFNMMVGGLSGLGKTTTVNALFRGWQAGAGSLSKEWARAPAEVTRDIDTTHVFERLDAPSNTVCARAVRSFGDSRRCAACSIPGDVAESPPSSAHR